MVCFDKTHVELSKYLQNTETTFNKLLSPYGGHATIKSTLDLGFPHDVIRIAGGFATGAYVEWESNFSIIPVDTCVNVCSCSFFEIDDDILNIFDNKVFSKLINKLNNGIYLCNFHRGNHFISYLKSKISGKCYLLLHSSASEFKDNYNGLYPVKNNWYFDEVKVFSYRNSYIRYIDGHNAKLFSKISQNLIDFNEIRQEFIAETLLNGFAKIKSVSHFHHYFMPNDHSVVMGSHIVSSGQSVPVLTVPGADIYMVNFLSAKYEDLYTDKEHFLTPHGWGKRHKDTPQIRLDVKNNKFFLDNIEYDIEFGESLRAHPNLELRDFNHDTLSRKESFFSYLSQQYDYSIVDELLQIASYNKDGVIVW